MRARVQTSLNACIEMVACNPIANPNGATGDAGGAVGMLQHWLGVGELLHGAAANYDITVVAWSG